ncbi:hypothetical protein BDZ85DRAFT_172710, partial [Elsinoe ampelina]
IPSLPPTISYLPTFLTPLEEETILLSLPSHKWTPLTHRRLQAHPSPLTKSGTLLACPLPPYLSSPILDRFTALGIFAGSPHGNPNHCLVNEYAPGQGIMPHEDGATYHPVTATVSLGGAVVLDVYEKVGQGGGQGGGEARKWRVLQERGSLLVTTGEVYGGTLHGIAEVEVDEDLGPETVANWELLGERERWEREGRNVRVTRTSLTYRDVVKVSDAG